jgi:uncharacterized membrane protein
MEPRTLEIALGVVVAVLYAMMYMVPLILAFVNDREVKWTKLHKKLSFLPHMEKDGLIVLGIIAHLGFAFLTVPATLLLLMVWPYLTVIGIAVAALFLARMVIRFKRKAAKVYQYIHGHKTQTNVKEVDLSMPWEKKGVPEEYDDNISGTPAGGGL